MDVRQNLAIIGAGPAGMTAAIYAARAGLDVTMIDSGAPGGKIVKTYEIENYPGYETISGVDLGMKMFDQTQKLNVKYQYGNVTRIENLGEKDKKIVMEDGSSIEAGAIIIATGTNERKMNIPGEAEYTGHGVSYCAVCDGAFFRDKTVTVIGGGNSALEEAIYLTQFASKVRIVIRRDVFRADELVQQKLAKAQKIEIIKKHIPLRIEGDGNKVSSIVLKNLENDQEETYETAGIFPYIGSDAATSFAESLNILDERGFVKANDKMETSVPGIYAAGDCIVKQLRQVVTACGDGALAAQNCYHYLKD